MVSRCLGRGRRLVGTCAILVLFLLAVPTIRGEQAAPATDNWFSSFDPRRGLTQTDELKKWFEVVAGQPQGIYQARTRLGTCGAIEGIVKLIAPWPPGHAFRFALDDYNRIHIHLFQANAGVTLVYHEDDAMRWVAYTTTRQPRSVTPSSWRIVGTDGWRNRRTSPKNHDQYELRWTAGEVILSRGDIVLIRAPLEGLPEEVFLQGRASVHSLSFVATPDFPKLEKIDQGDRVIELDKMTWQQQIDPQAVVDRTASRVELRTNDAAAKRSWTATPIPRDTLSELVLQIGNVAPGAGIYLGNGKDGPRHVLRYVADRRSGELCLVPRHDDDHFEQDFRGSHEAPLPCIGPQHWVKLVFASGGLRWWISPDGTHWAEPGEPIRNLPPDVTHLGLHCVARRATSIRLDRLTVRPLRQLDGLIPKDLLARAHSQPDAASLGLWVADVTERTPSNCDTGDWRRACAVKSLAKGCNRVLGNELLMLLAEDKVTQSLPLKQRLLVLEEVALLLDVWDDNNVVQRYVRAIHRSGEAARLDNPSAAFSTIRYALMSAPLATRHNIDVSSESLVRSELLAFVYARQWLELRRFTQMVRFFQFQSQGPLVDWADAIASRNLPDGSSRLPDIEKNKSDWRETLVEDLDKDVYNVLAQLRADTESGNSRDAARVIVSAGEFHGVAPHPSDSDLLVSFAVALECMTRDNEPLRVALAKDFGELAKLKFRKARADADDHAMQRIADTFPTTEAAMLAHRWMGDRALARGRFAQSRIHYEKAGGTEAEIALKKTLAASFDGRVTPAPTSAVPSIGSVKITSADFEQLVREMAERSGKESVVRTIGVGQNSPRVAIPPPASYAVQRRSRLDGQVGNDPNREFARETAKIKADWVDRQIGVAVDGRQMYVSNRFQVAAYDLDSKQRIWQTQAPPGQIQFAQESTFTAARPLIGKDRFFARLLYHAGGTLAAIDRSNGQFVWTTAAKPNEEYVSDPFFLDGKLSCFKMVQLEQQELMLRLVRFDIVTGGEWKETDVVRLRDTWRKRRYCEFTVLDDGILVAAGGTTARVEPGGNVCWIRRHRTLPADDDPTWIHQFFQPPMVQTNRVFVTQPGVRSIECIHAGTGELIWSQTIADIERMVDFVGSHLICETSRGLMALDPSDGQTGWLHDVEGLTVAIASGPDQGLAYLQRLATDATNSRYRVRFVWLDSEKGIVRATTTLPDLEEADPRLGPLIVDQDRLWTFWGRGQNEPTRDVIELTPNGTATVEVARVEPDDWTRSCDMKLRQAAAELCPAWTILHAEFGDNCGRIGELQGERDVLGFRFRNSGATALGREIAMPKSSVPRLRFKAGTDPSQAWRIEVRFRGELVWSQDVNGSTHPNFWKQFELELPNLAGQEGWLTIRSLLPQGGDAPIYWKNPEVVL